jgi:hypothetical protein
MASVGYGSIFKKEFSSYLEMKIGGNEALVREIRETCLKKTDLQKEKIIDIFKRIQAHIETNPSYCESPLYRNVKACLYTLTKDPQPMPGEMPQAAAERRTNRFKKLVASLSGHVYYD